MYSLKQSSETAPIRKQTRTKGRAVKEELELIKKKYEDDLLEEINEDRICTGKKPVTSMKRVEYSFDEETGEQIEIKEKKTVKKSTTDPECGCFHKGEKEQCFAYSHQTFCERNGFVLEVKTVPGNVHDSVSFYEAYAELNQKYGKNEECITGCGIYKSGNMQRDIYESSDTLHAL